MINILFGKSASGKDTILNQLINRYDGYQRVVSTTSRPIRDGEVPGVDYHYKTREEFEQMIKDNLLIEYRSYNTLVNGIPDVWYYGVAKQDFSDKNYIAVLDITGIESFIKVYGKENIRCCYVHVSENTRELRAQKRGSFDKTEWDRRVKDDAVKFETQKILSVADVILVNDDDTSEFDRSGMPVIKGGSLEEKISMLNHILS